MGDVVVARHGESVTGASGIVAGDVLLAIVARERAPQLGRELAAFLFDVCITSGAPRAQETAAIALQGRDVPCEIVDAFGDIDFGELAGGSLGAFRQWIGSPYGSPLGLTAGELEERVARLERWCDAAAW